MLRAEAFAMCRNGDVDISPVGLFAEIGMIGHNQPATSFAYNQQFGFL
jgi:hypothetical protein